MSHFSKQRNFQPTAVIELRRSLLDMSQREFANELRCSVDTVKNWEHHRTEPSGQFVERMFHLAAERAHAGITDIPPLFGV